MEGARLVLDALGRVRDTLKDLSPEELLAGPRPHIAWLVWHLSRVQDANFSGLMNREQLWIEDGWHARFKMAPDPKDYGSGHRLDRSNTDLNNVLNEPQYQPLPTLSIRLLSVIHCNTRHAGQIEYLRGLIKHQGWFPGSSR